MNYNDYTIKSFVKSIAFPLTLQPHTLSFASSGDSLCAAFNQNVHIYDPINAKLKTKIDIQNNKADYFTENTLLLSNKNCLSYLSLYDTTLLRKFIHNTDIHDFSVSDNDLLMTFSDCIQIYDIKNPNPLFRIRIKNGFGTFLDDTTLVVGNSSMLKWYDTRNVKGPVQMQSAINIQKIKYYGYANIMVLQNFVKRTHIFMEKNGNVKNKIVFDQKYNTDLTSDGKYYLASSSNIIKVYDVDKKSNIYTYRDSEFIGGSIAINPAYGQFVTSNNNVRFWQPETD